MECCDKDLARRDARRQPAAPATRYQNQLVDNHIEFKSERLTANDDKIVRTHIIGVRAY